MMWKTLKTWYHSILLKNELEFRAFVLIRTIFLLTAISASVYLYTQEHIISKQLIAVTIVISILLFIFSLFAIFRKNEEWDNQGVIDKLPGYPSWASSTSAGCW